MRILSLIGTLVIATAMFGQNTVEFDKLTDQYFDRYFAMNPTAATATGFHQFDGKLEDYSQAEIHRQIATYHEFREKFAKIDASQFSIEKQDDLALIKASIDSTLLELETIKMWQRNPDKYSGGITNSVFGIMSRKFASQPERLKSVVARERQMPAVFAAARKNLRDVPKVYVEIAIEQIPGIVSFFQNDVPKAFSDVHDQKLLGEFKETNEAVITELKSYQAFLQKEVLPKANGDFRIGTENYRKKLASDEMVDVPLDKLIEIGMADLKRNQAEFRHISKLIDPSKTPQQILDQAQKDHPTSENLIPTFRNMLSGLKGYIETNHIVTIPSPVPPIVEETPPFMRALTSASMDTPGPYEKVAKEAFFNVTLPEPTWTADQTREWLEGFNRGTIASTAIHEAYPGHYTQFLWMQHIPSKVRKLLGSGSNAEGWAHYTEQMMLDEGYGRDKSVPEAKDAKFLMLRLGQLQDALLRNARFIVGIKMHTGQMTFGEGVKFFQEEGLQNHQVSVRETRRGTSDPTYLVYTLGKLQILKLRDDYQHKMGTKFSLQEFHDKLLQNGFAPLKIVRREMLGNDSPTL